MVLDSIHLQNFHYPTVAWVNIFAVDMSSSVYIDNKDKNIFILGKGPPEESDYYVNSRRSIFN